MVNEKALVPVNRNWFYNHPEKYLSREDFKQYQKFSGVDFTDLMSNDENIVRAAQQELSEQSTIFNEVRNEHSGFGMPFLVYTHNFNFADPVPRQNMNLEKISFGLDMVDSLRRRHIALSNIILPENIREIQDDRKSPISIYNMGSGVGLDVINAVRNTNGSVNNVLNCDINRKAIQLGKRITAYLEDKKYINKGVIKYEEGSMMDMKGKADLVVLVGVICGLRDAAAYVVLKKAYDSLNENGKIVLSAANEHMESDDPLSSFLIQHVGSKDEVHKSWGLNYRTKDHLYSLMKKAGFKDIQIYDDANYPNREKLPANILNSVDNLPSKVEGFEYTGKPVNLPSQDILDRRIGYNSIGIARK